MLMSVFLICAIGDVPSPRTALAAMTFAGFALNVWALGTLIRCRPPLGCDGSVHDPSGLWERHVIRLVQVMVVLSVFDLVCTLFHRDLGNLYELNPLAVPLMTHAPTVVAFKLSLTIGAAIGFFVARSCRLAQVGCWWVVVAYTILILRWNSYY
jgi:hypothetical protein